ncbi:glutamine-hydrolyzing GMP synthase [Patescibacteria group bacterium]|nr:glutamine-hydrolyzing GMP synthase [Patescibacteria group bacterium]
MDRIAVLDFGGQYAHLIANRIRRLGVYSEIFDGDVAASELRDFKGIILSGGPSSVNAEHGLRCDKEIMEMGVPILGICYGHQLIAYHFGGKVEKGAVREYGMAEVNFSERSGVFEGVSEKEPVWMSHFDQVVEAPEGFKVVASSKDCAIAAMSNEEKRIFSLQFHPEVTHSPCGMTILENFVKITGAKREWSIESYIKDIGKEIVEKVGENKVFLMISGGVDSTVAFLLLDKALGQKKVYGLFVDTGFMRKGERKEVEESLKAIGVENLHVYDAKEEYFEALKSVYDPEKKREIIGDLFLDIQAKVSDDLSLNPKEWMLGQGTIYPDTIETGGTKHADKIKTHHNRVERVQKLIDQGRVIEPIAQLYKDEVRLVGEKLGLREDMVWRHPFPGPGLAVRCLCAENEYEVDKDLEDRISESLEESSISGKVMPVKSVGVQGDERSYAHPLCLYGEPKSWNQLEQVATQMTNQHPEVNRVVFLVNKRELGALSIQKNYLTSERINLLQEADKIVMDYLVEAKIHREIWQFPTVLLPIGVDSQNGESLVLRPVCSEEAMTANFYKMDMDVLNELSKRLMGLDGISAVFYDITNKPPGTIEWE